MKNFNYARFVIALAPLLFIGCLNGPSDPSGTSEGAKGVAKDGERTGAVSMTVTLEKTEVLAKRSDIGLKKLLVVLSSTDKDSIFDTILVSGNTQTVVPKTYANLSPEKSWTLSARSFDLKDSLIHSGSVGFSVEAGQTKIVSLLLTSRFAMLKAKYFPVMDSVTRCELSVGGKVVASTSFAKQSRLGDTINLSYDYLAANVAASVKMAVYGTFAGQDMLLYTGSTGVLAQSNSAPLDIRLMYVGPWTPTGKMAMQVTLSAVKTVNAVGQLQDKPKGLIAYYPLNGDAKDQSGYGNHGIVTGAVPGKNKYLGTNTAMQFDGDQDYIKVPNPASFSTTKSISAMAWIKPDQITGGYTVFGKGWNFSITINDAFYGFSYGTYGLSFDGRSVISFNNCVTTVATKAGEWAHVAGTYDGTTIRLYVNFKLAASLAAPYNLNPPTTSELIMGENFSSAFKGTLDEVRLYDYALSEKEITALGTYYSDYKNF